MDNEYDKNNNDNKAIDKNSLLRELSDNDNI